MSNARVLPKPMNTNTRLGLIAGLTLATLVTIGRAQTASPATTDTTTTTTTTSTQVQSGPDNSAVQMEKYNVNDVPLSQQILPTARPFTSVFGTEDNILDVPRNVTIVSRAQMDTIDIQDVTDFSKLTSSSYTDSNFGSPANPTIRGQSADVFMNGMRQRIGESGDGMPIDFNFVESVNIVPGPATAVQGASAYVGGFVDLISKQPFFDKAQSSIQLRVRILQHQPLDAGLRRPDKPDARLPLQLRRRGQRRVLVRLDQADHLGLRRAQLAPDQVLRALRRREGVLGGLPRELRHRPPDPGADFQRPLRPRHQHQQRHGRHRGGPAERLQRGRQQHDRLRGAGAGRLPRDGPGSRQPCPRPGVQRPGHPEADVSSDDEDREQHDVQLHQEGHVQLRRLQRDREPVMVPRQPHRVHLRRAPLHDQHGSRGEVPEHECLR